jgi:hypothetical protein
MSSELIRPLSSLRIEDYWRWILRHLVMGQQWPGRCGLLKWMQQLRQHNKQKVFL